MKHDLGSRTLGRRRSSGWGFTPRFAAITDLDQELRKAKWGMR